MTPSGSNVVDQARDLIRQRIDELDAERAGLERALADLNGGRSARRRPGRPRGSSNSKPAGRKRRSGTRAEQAVKLVEESPGIGAGEIAKRLGIAPNYMYRVMNELEKEGRVRKDGRKYTVPQTA